MFRIHRFGWLLLAAAAPLALAADPPGQSEIQQSAAPKAASAQRAAAAPRRMVALFVKRSSCPDGWEPATNTYGRLIVATTTGGNVGVTAGAAMSSGNVLLHFHSAPFSVSLASKSIAAANSPCLKSKHLYLKMF